MIFFYLVIEPLFVSSRSNSQVSGKNVLSFTVGSLKNVLSSTVGCLGRPLISDPESRALVSLLGRFKIFHLRKIKPKLFEKQETNI